MVLFLFPQPPISPAAAPPPSYIALSHCRAANVTMLRCRHRRSHRAAAIALPPLRCAPQPRFALPPSPLTLPPPQRRRQAATNIPLSCCRHRLAAAKLPPTSRFCAAATAAAAALLPPRCRRCTVRRCRAAAAAALLPTLRCCAAATAAAVAPPFVGWLLRCCLPSDFVIACCHATINALLFLAAFANRN
jgi:hypothetical protein